MTSDTPDERLLPNERVVWRGRPSQGLLLTRRDMVLIPVSLVWGGFAISWIASAVKMRLPAIGYVWGALFVGSSVYILALRFVIDAWLRRRTSYVVTDQRVLIERAPPFGVLTVVSRASFQTLNFVPLNGDRGTIALGNACAKPGYRGGAGWIPVLDTTPQLLAITNARHVFGLLQRSAPGECVEIIEAKSIH